MNFSGVLTPQFKQWIYLYGKTGMSDYIPNSGLARSNFVAWPTVCPNLQKFDSFGHFFPFVMKTPWYIQIISNFNSYFQFSTTIPPWLAHPHLAHPHQHQMLPTTNAIARTRRTRRSRRSWTMKKSKPANLYSLFTTAKYPAIVHTPPMPTTSNSTMETPCYSVSVTDLHLAHTCQILLPD